jgi:hypothetical protein
VYLSCAPSKVAEVNEAAVASGVAVRPMGDQDVLMPVFLRNMSCLPPRFNCRVHHASTAYCFGLPSEDSVWEGAG